MVINSREGENAELVFFNMRSLALAPERTNWMSLASLVRLRHVSSTNLASAAVFVSPNCNNFTFYIE